MGNINIMTDANGVLHTSRDNVIYSYDMAHVTGGQCAFVSKTNDLNTLINGLANDLITADSRIAELETHLTILLQRGVISRADYDECMGNKAYTNQEVTKSR